MKKHNFKGDTQPQFKPEFIRLPRTGSLCPHSGLSRTSLNELILPMNCNDHKPPVDSISFKQNGNIRGVRLIHFDSLISFINTPRASL